MSREEFEALPEVKDRLKSCYYSDKHNCYLAHYFYDHATAAYLNGAYYAFCEQKKKIDLLLGAICGTNEELNNDRARD